MNSEPDIVLKYAPAIYFDENEPFFPRKVGYTVFEKGGASPSFNRTIEFCDGSVRRAIEYAIYWDFDIEHMYELEHVWVYVSGEGEVLECESSFHGFYLRSLLQDRSNIEDGSHVRVYSQPGKHAFLPAAEMFELLPKNHLYAPAWENAGSGGLMIPAFLQGSLETNESRNAAIRAYLQKMRFVPSMRFVRHSLPGDAFLPWPELLRQIPRFIEEKLKEIERPR